MVYTRTKPGQKTRRMWEVEANLGRTLEDDYREFYIEKKWGQKRLADRWGVKRNLIFESSKRNRSRSWVEMLGLSVRRETDPQVSSPSRSKPSCEACSEDGVPLERAHWKEAKQGGLASLDNILLLCPNCHTKLDRGVDHAFIEKVRAILLHRSVSKLLGTRCRPEQLLFLCQEVLSTRNAP